MRLNLHTKLVGGFVVMLLLMVVVGLVGMYTSKHIQNHLEDTVEQDVKAANTLGVVARRVGFIHSNSLLHLFTRSVEDMNRYESEIADWEGKISTDIDTLENTFQDQETLDKLAEVRAAWDTYLRIWREQIVPLSRANRDEEAFALARKRGAAGTAAQEAMYKLDELHEANVAAASHSLELAEQDFRKSQNILLAVTLLATIFGLAFGIKQSSLIAGAVNTVSKAAQLVAAGDLAQSVVVRTGDEIESMADSFNKMTSNMKKMVEELRHEITERKRAEESLASSNAKLAAANKELEAFSYSVSHDMRAPLRAMNGFSRILLEEHAPELSPEAQRYLHLVCDNAYQMSQLIDDLLTFSRLSRRPLEKQPVAPADIVRQVFTDLRGEQEGRRIEISIGDLPPCQADSALLKQVYVNLLSNALKFTRGREIARIEVGCRQTDGEHVYFVKDNGVGFDMRYADKLFGVFQRLHRAEDYEGTGVGLAIVQRIIHRHGGRVWAEAEVDKGATFHFTI